MNSENEFSKTFNKEILSEDREFDKSEYSLVERVFENDVFIEEALRVIENLCMNKKIDLKYLYLILGDFLFSMSIKEVVNPENLILRVTRNQYIGEIRLRAVINAKIIDPDLYIELHKKLLIGLRNSGLISRKIALFYDENWSSQVILSISIKSIEVRHMIESCLSKEPFLIRKIGTSTYCVKSFRSMFKLKRKRREMVSREIDYSGVKRMCSLGLNLSSETYLLVKNLIDCERDKVLLKNGVNSLEEYFSKIKRVLNDEKYVIKMLLTKEKIDDVDY